jgi:hypothetical protein
VKGRYRQPFSLAALLCSLWMACAPAAAEDMTVTRPGHGAEADEVTVTVGLLDIVGIDNRTQLFTVDLYVQIEWHDPRLAADSDETSELRTFALSEIWWPHLVILNNRGLDLLLPEVVTVDRQGNVELRQRLVGPLAVELDLREFPFDTQRLPIKIVSYRYGPDELVFSDESELLGQLDDLSSGGWVFSLAASEMSVYRLSDARRGTSELAFAVMAERQASYYAITLALPMTLILFLAWMVHWLPPDLVPARMGMASATVFSLIALGVSFRLTMPDIAYLTNADRFVLYSTLLLIASLAATVASVRRIHREDLDAAMRLTRTARWLFPLAYIGILVVLVNL